MTKVFTIAHLPQELTQAWMQHLRDFDTAHPGCHFEVAAEAPNATLAEVVRALQINPSLDFTAIYEREKKTPNRSAESMRSFHATDEYRRTLVPLATLEVWADEVDRLEREIAAARFVAAWITEQTENAATYDQGYEDGKAGRPHGSES
jgi:hypothetical protein